MELISKSSAYKSDPPTIIIPDFFYLGDSKTACWLPHFVNWNITHVINLSGCSNFWETKDKIDYEISNLEFDDEMTNDLDEFKEEVVGKDINNKPLFFVNNGDNTSIPKFAQNNQVGNNKVTHDKSSPSSSPSTKQIYQNFDPPKYLKIDILDDPKSNISKYFNQCIEFIEKAKESNGRVYVHCYAGISRSTTVVIAYLMYSCRFSLKKALNLVREKHKIVRPNSGFIRQLEKFEKEISLKD
nr:10539_t:CDS:2 [Entrophospora candida]